MTPLQLILFYISCCVSSPLIHKYEDASFKQLFCWFLLMIPRMFPYIRAQSIPPGFSDALFFSLFYLFPTVSLFHHLSSVPHFPLLAFVVERLSHMFG